MTSGTNIAKFMKSPAIGWIGHAWHLEWGTVFHPVNASSITGKQGTESYCPIACHDYPASSLPRKKIRSRQ